MKTVSSFQSPLRVQHFCTERVIHWYRLYRSSSSPILTHKWYCWGWSRGSRGEPYASPVKAGLIFQMYQLIQKSYDGSTRTSTQRDLLFVCQQRRDIFYPSLVDKTYPSDYTSGAIPSATPANDWGHQAAWPQGLTLLCFNWPLFLLPPHEPKASILSNSPSFPSIPLPHCFHTRTNKEMGPLQFSLTVLWNQCLLQEGGGKIIGKGFN